jgi:uncharacterized protein (DUF58 family)
VKPLWLAALELSLAVSPLVLLAWLARVYPYRPLVYLALLPGLLSLLLLGWPSLLPPLLVLDGLVALIALVDVLSLPRHRALQLERQLGRTASLAQSHPVELAIENRSKRPQMIWIRDDLPPGLVADPPEFSLRMAGRSRVVVKYHLHARRRGAFELPAVHVRARSRWGLWQRLLDYPLTSEVNVYPDMKQLSEYSLLARNNRLNLIGLRRTRRIGQDNEFERLRDYTPDDHFRHIDWRSTARRVKLTVRDFQANQSQRVMVLVDCGRMMAGESGGLSLLDHALNAVLMLAYVALSKGDSVGLLCFSDEVHKFVPPRGGLRQMNRLLHASFDRFPRLVESRYDEAFLYLGTHCRKRSLVILVTNIIDEVNANQVRRYLRGAAGRHLPLGVLLRDRRLFEAVDGQPADDEALYRAAAAAGILNWRHQVLRDLAAGGALSLDVFPDQLTAPLVNRYLEVKARQLL